MEGDIFMVLWILGGILLPFFPVIAIIYLAFLIAATFIPARWFGL